MGDFGSLIDNDGLHLTNWLDNKFLHDVTLDSFSIMQYRVTYEDYAIYTAYKGIPSITEEKGVGSIEDKLSKIPNMPVMVTWKNAKNCCTRLGKVTGLPIDLPTEAQWEYAARNKGQFVIFAIDDGNAEEGRNFMGEDERTALVSHLDRVPTYFYPVGIYPPSPLGLYDMGLGESEYINDWYDADYYTNSPQTNPKEPEAETQKVLRGSVSSNLNSHTTVSRSKLEKNPPPYAMIGDMIRCVVNSPEPIK